MADKDPESFVKRQSRRDMLRNSLLLGSAAALGIGTNEVFGADKEKEEKGRKAKLVPIDPLLPRKKLELDDQYSARYQRYFHQHARNYLVPMYNALQNPKQPYPILEETVPEYARCIKPAGTPVGDGLLPCLLLSTDRGDQTVKGTMYKSGLTLEITINEDGKSFQAYGGMDGCSVAYNGGAWKKFPAGTAAQQAMKIPEKAKKGDVVSILIPQAVLTKAAVTGIQKASQSFPEIRTMLIDGPQR